MGIQARQQSKARVLAKIGSQQYTTLFLNPKNG